MRELKATFNDVPALYDRARPEYPEAMFREMLAVAELPTDGRVLEIGCGTGIATLPMAEMGYRITAVELGEDMAAVARAKLARFPNVRVETAAFEDWPLPADSFDFVMVAQAYHWLEPKVRLVKIAGALRPGGSLAIFGNAHVNGGDEEFFVEVQECYERLMPGTPPGLRLPDPDDVQDEYAEEVQASGLFAAPVSLRYPWVAEYTTATYLDVLNTYSNHIALEPAAREALLGCVAALIDSHYGGRVRKQYLTLLLVARRL